MKNHTRTSSSRLLPAFLAVALLLAAQALTGCVVMAAGAGAAGTVAYMGRNLESTLPNDYNKVVRAAEDSIAQLEFSKVSEQKDALKAVLVARTALDKKVEITITNMGKKSTKVDVVVGLMGDKELSMAVLDKIKANL